MECREIQTRLACGEIPDASMSRHLESCDACRAFSASLRDVKRLLAASVVTPDRLRVDTLTRCRDELAESPDTLLNTRRFRDRLTPQLIAVGALLGTAILIGVSIGLADASGEAATRFTVQSTFIQLVIQNLAAALLAPALWPLMRRLIVRPADLKPAIGV